MRGNHWELQEHHSQRTALRLGVRPSVLKCADMQFGQHLVFVRGPGRKGVTVVERGNKYRDQVKRTQRGDTKEPRADERDGPALEGCSAPVSWQHLTSPLWLRLSCSGRSRAGCQTRGFRLPGPGSRAPPRAARAAACCSWRQHQQRAPRPCPALPARRGRAPAGRLTARRARGLPSGTRQGPGRCPAGKLSLFSHLPSWEGKKTLPRARQVDPPLPLSSAEVLAGGRPALPARAPPAHSGGGCRQRPVTHGGRDGSPGPARSLFPEQRLSQAALHAGAVPDFRLLVRGKRTARRASGGARRRQPVLARRTPSQTTP